MLYGRGVFVNRCFDELNLSNPNLVKQVHAEYLEAGAEVIETNTFGAHRFKLGPHGLEGQVRKINREGARIAREAVGEGGLVAGAMGRSESRSSRSAASGGRGAGGLPRAGGGAAEGGVDVFVIETMPSLDQAKAALAAVRSLGAEQPSR
jgi:homocysteine S-methyltransferase